MSTNFTTQEEVSVTPLSFKLRKATLTTNSGHVIKNFGDMLHNIKIHEAIYRGSIIVEIFVEDPINLFSEVKLAGNEKIILDLGRTEPLEGETGFEMELYISDVGQTSQTKPSVRTYTITCVSKHVYINSKKCLNKAFNGDAKSLIRSITKKELGTKLDVQKNCNTNGLMTGIYPNLTPIAAIAWLLRNSNDNGTPVYFYETAKKGLILDSYASMLSGKLLPFNTYNRFPNLEQSLFRNKEQFAFEEERAKIRAVRSSLNLSKLTPASNGVFGSNARAIDISDKKIKDEKEIFYSYDKLDKSVMLNDFPPAIAEMKVGDTPLFEINNSKKYYYSSNDLAFGSGTTTTPTYHSSNEFSNALKCNAIKENLNTVILNVDLAGDFNLIPGAVVNLEFIKQAEISEELEEGRDFNDLWFSGNYLVTKITHEFGKDGYIMYTTLQKDSFKTKQLDEF
tara:strand:+ start:202 stop:1557 length:1356 start_codon:yes stop_codon:yes gene_type:complete